MTCWLASSPGTSVRWPIGRPDSSRAAWTRPRRRASRLVVIIGLVVKGQLDAVEAAAHPAGHHLAGGLPRPPDGLGRRRSAHQPTVSGRSPAVAPWPPGWCAPRPAPGVSGRPAAAAGRVGSPGHRLGPGSQGRCRRARPGATPIRFSTTGARRPPGAGPGVGQASVRLTSLGAHRARGPFSGAFTSPPTTAGCPSRNRRGRPGGGWNLSPGPGSVGSVARTGSTR